MKDYLAGSMSMMAIYLEYPRAILTFLLPYIVAAFILLALKGSSGV